jgi:hypothetical protein
VRPRSMNEVRQLGPFKCHFCNAVLVDKSRREAQEWDWVTGYLPTTEHCCPTCQKTHRAMWQEILNRATKET